MQPPASGPHQTASLYQALFERSPVPLWVRDGETFKFLAVNDRAIERYGYSREEFLQLDIFAIRPPEEEAAVRRRISERGSVTLWREVYTHMTKSGERFFAEVTIHPITVDRREAFLVAAVDVTHRVLAERELRASQAHFRRMADQVPVAIWTCDLQGKCTFANREWLEWRGRTIEEECAGVWLRDMHPEDMERFEATLLDAIQKRTPYAIEYRMLNRHAEYREILESGRPFYAEDGSMEGFIGNCSDVTDMKRAESQLTRHRELLQTTLDAVPTMIEVIDPKGKLLFGNRELERVLGWSPAEIQAIQERGGSFSSLLYPDEKERLRAIEFSMLGAGTWIEFTPRVRDGRTINLTWATVRLSDGSVVGVGQDITAQKRLEDELRQSQRMESVGRLAGGVAHDFNNLLTALLGYTEIASRHAGDNSKLRESLTEIQRAGERAAALTSQLLALSRKQVVTPRVLDLSVVIQDMSGMFRRLIGEDILLRTEFEPALPPVRADLAQIEQILLNLVVNARDAMPRGGELRIALRSAAAGDSIVPRCQHVFLEISDTGHGITPEVKRQIFEPFFTTKPVGEGTGLGLSTVYGIVRQMGGSIEVESEPGAGAMFRLTIPAAADAARAPETHVKSELPAGHETILLVEDDVMVRELTSEMLRLGGYRVIAAPNGGEAVAILKRGVAADLVVSDLVMPGLNGWQVREQAALTRPGLPFLFMSGYAGDDIARRGIQTEGVAFLPKPFRAEDLHRQVTALLEPLRAAGR
ncbi:MAG: PAS domain S-box protein [Candidatus Eisenbacteria bacterium]